VEEVARELRRIRNEELYNLHSSPHIRVIKSRKMRWAALVARIGDIRNSYHIFVSKPEGKRLVGRPKHRWVDNIRMDIREIVWKVVDWMHLAQDRDQWRVLVNTVMNLRVP
jgi:hypothetical protein